MPRRTKFHFREWTSRTPKAVRPVARQTDPSAISSSGHGVDSARNAALARAPGDDAFWLDADDVIDPPEREELGMPLDRSTGRSPCREGQAPAEPADGAARAAWEGEAPAEPALGIARVLREGEAPAEPAGILHARRGRAKHPLRPNRNFIEWVP
jgi:glycosyltransferase involved in cell wall biosynthesis